MPGFTALPPLERWAVGLIHGGIPALTDSSLALPSIDLVRAACSASSLPEMADRLSREGPADLLQAAADIAKSRETQGRLAEAVGPEGRLALQNDAVQLEQMIGTKLPLKLVLLGDIHSRWNRVQAILDHEFPHGYGTALCVGDLETYPILAGGHRVYFTHGNHERFVRVAALHAGTDPAVSGLTPIFAGEVIVFGALKIAGLPGIHSPYYYEHPDGAPIKYFTPAEIEAMRAIPRPVDILLTHPAPHGFGFGKEGEDHGAPLLTGLMQYLRPQLLLFGHHHQRFEGRWEETRVVGLDYPHRSYLVLDFDPTRDELQVTEHRATLRPGPGHMEEYQFDWQCGNVPHGNISPPRRRDVAPMGGDGGGESGFSPPFEPSDPALPVTRRISEGGVAIFDGGIHLDKEKRVERLLRERHGESVRQRLVEELRAEVTGGTAGERDFQARARAAAAVNTAIGYAARYAAALEANPNLTLEERQALMQQIHQEMTRSIPTQAGPDLILAFERFLQALGIVEG